MNYFAFSAILPPKAEALLPQRKPHTFPAFWLLYLLWLLAGAVQAMPVETVLKQQVEAIRVGGERCPGNGEDGIGTPESYAGTYVTRATVGEFDDGTCGFELEFGNTGNAQIDGRKLWWDMGSDNEQWHCSSEVDDKWLPLDCRG